MVEELNDPSGSGFFGKGYWGNKVYWLNVPAQWRRLDANEYLQRLLKTWGDLGEDLIDNISILPSQRDPYEVRTRETLTRWFYVTESFEWDDSDKGEVTRLIGERDFTEMPNTDEDDPPIAYPEVKTMANTAAWAEAMAESFPWWPYEPLAKVGRWWQLFWGDARYEVVNVRSRNYDQPEIFNDDTSLANEVWVKGGDLTLIFDYITDRLWDEDLPALRGTPVIGEADGSFEPTVSLSEDILRLERRDGDSTTAPSMAVSDSTVRIRIPMNDGTFMWLYDVPDVDDLDVGTLNVGPDPLGGGPYVITSTVCGAVNYLSGAISLELNSPSLGDNEWTDDPQIRCKYKVEGYYMRFNAPPTIDYLAKDYGFKNDQNDPEAVQRSSIANITKYWGQKSTQNSYLIRGAISLFDVVMQGLYRVCEDRAWQLPEGSYYEVEVDGVIRVYTEVKPVFIRYDHIASDEQFWDAQNFFGGVPQWVPLVDRMLIATDEARWDGMATGQAYAVDVTQGYYGKVSPFNSNLRGAATVNEVNTLSAEELDVLGWRGGYRYKIEMSRAQYEAFNFLAERFALSVYSYDADPSAGTPPGVDDTFYYIDQVDEAWPASALTTPTSDKKEDKGEWWVLIAFAAGVDSPIAVNDDIAVRYVPSAGSMDCCYCRSNNMRGIIDTTESAYDYYKTVGSIDSAIERLKEKLVDELVPIHSRVIEWEVTRRLEDTMSGVHSGAVVRHTYDKSVFDGAVDDKLTVTVKFKGSTDASGITAGVRFWDGTAWVSSWDTGAFTGSGDADEWQDVATDTEIDITAFEEMELYCEAGSTATAGELEFAINVTKREVP